MMFGWMPSVGSSRRRSFGFVISARNSKLLVLPYRQIAAAPVQHRLENWKKGRRFFLGRIFAGAKTTKPGFQVLADGQHREDETALGHIANPDMGKLIRTGPVTSMPSNMSGVGFLVAP